MNIFIVTAGSRGGVQPYVALGEDLKDSWHTTQAAHRWVDGD